MFQVHITRTIEAAAPSGQIFPMDLRKSGSKEECIDAASKPMFHGSVMAPTQISVEELGEAMKQAGQELTDDELKDMIKAVDRNGNGKVEYTEFEDMMASQIGEPMTGDDLKFYFKKFDQNGDGFITSDELALVMKTFGGKSYSKKEIDDMIVEADTDSDGKVSYEEFVQMVTTKH